MSDRLEFQTIGPFSCCLISPKPPPMLAVHSELVNMENVLEAQGVQNFSEFFKVGLSFGIDTFIEKHYRGEREIGNVSHSAYQWSE